MKIFYRTLFLRNIYSPLKPFLKPIFKKLFPKYFSYNTLEYWKKIEGPHYFKYWSKQHENQHSYQLQCKILIDQLKKIDFNSLLDYGCGYGRILKIIENKFPNASIEGCDVSHHQLDNARQYIGTNSECKLFLCDGKKIPRTDNTYDVVYTVDVLLHQTHDLINDIRREILRVSNKFIVLFEGNYKDDEVEKDKIINNIEKTTYKHNHIEFFINNGCRLLTEYKDPKFWNSIMLFEKIQNNN